MTYLAFIIVVVYLSWSLFAASVASRAWEDHFAERRLFRSEMIAQNILDQDAISEERSKYFAALQVCDAYSNTPQCAYEIDQISN